MTFSDTKVRKLLRTRFVCGWENTEGDKSAGASFAHAPGTPAGTCIRGNGEHNIQMLLLTPDGRLLGVLAGYIAPEDLVQELEFALSVQASLADEGRMAPEDRVVAAHREFLDALAAREKGGGGDRDARPLADWERRRTRADHRFSMKHALMDAADFRPTALVGNATTFFGSSSGGKPEGTIGDADAAERMRKRIEEMLEGAAPAEKPEGEGDGRTRESR